LIQAENAISLIPDIIDYIHTDLTSFKPIIIVHVSKEKFLCLYLYCLVKVVMVFYIWKNVHGNSLSSIKSVYELEVSLRNLVIVIFVYPDVRRIKVILFFPSNILNL